MPSGFSSSEDEVDHDASDTSSSSDTSSGIDWSAAEDGDAENGGETVRPDVLDKPQPQCDTRFLADLLKRELCGPRLRPSFARTRMRSLGLVKRLALAHKLHGHAGCVNALHFNSSGSLLASGSDDLDIILWDWASKKARVKIPSGHRANVFQSKFLPLQGDCDIVSCSRDGKVIKATAFFQRQTL